MKKIIKISAIILLVLLLVLFISPVLFKGRVKSIVLKEANKSLNAKLDVGQISISLIRNFPDLRVGLTDIMITGQGIFEGDTLLIMKSVSVSTGLMDLINGSPYKITRIGIDQADVRLKVLSGGEANWDIIKASGSMDEVETPESEESLRLLLKSLEINDSRLVYDDLQNATYARLEGLDHHLSGDLGADFTLLETKTTIQKTHVTYDGVNYLEDAVVDWTAEIDADLVKYIYTFRDNKLVINDFPVIFSGTIGMPDDGYDLDLAFSTPESGFKPLLSLVPAVYARDFKSVNTDGRMAFDGFVKGKYAGDLYPAFLLNLIVENAWFRYPGLPAEVKNINIGARIESPGGDLDNTVIDVKNIALDLAGNPVRARLYLKNPITDPYIDANIDAKINLADIGKFYPLGDGEAAAGEILADITLKGLLSAIEQERYNDFEATGSFMTSGVTYKTAYLAQEIRINKASLTVTPRFLDLAELKVKAGTSDFSLDGKLENYLAYYLKGETLTGNFNLNSTRIDANELLSFTEPGGEPANSETEIVSAFIVPAGIDFILKLSASSVKYMNFDITNLAGQIRIKDQKLILDGITMNGLGGKLQLSGSYASADPENPAYDIDLGINDISISDAFRHFAAVEKFAPIAEKIAGDLSGKVKLAGLMDGQMMPRLETLAGAGDLITSAIRITNVNTLNQLSSSLKMDQLKELIIDGAKVMVEFLDGAMEVKPFDFKALGIDMNLGGRTSLDQQIGYMLKMKIPRSMMGGAANTVINDLVSKAGQAGADVKVGDYINVDALIEGTVTDPKVKLNLAGTGKDIVESVKEQVQDQIEQKVEEAKDMAKEEAEKILQDADRRAQAILDEAKKQSDEVLKKAQGLADETKKQASVSADKIITEAKGKGFIAEAAAKKSAEEVKKQGDKQAQNIVDEAKKQSDAILSKARLEADKVKADAQKKINP